jgi:hypothetical protein
MKTPKMIHTKMPNGIAVGGVPHKPTLLLASCFLRYRLHFQQDGKAGAKYAIVRDRHFW